VLRELKDGRLLAGTVDGGAAIGFPRQAFQRYTRQQGLPHDWIRCAMEDREGISGWAPEGEVSPPSGRNGFP
jgi:hypothetical protein